MTMNDDEDTLLRSVALQNATSILVARQRAEQRRDAYLAEAQKLSHTGSFGWSVSTGEIGWSEETFRIFQYDRSITPTVECILQRVHPEDAALVKQTIERASREGHDFEYATRLARLTHGPFRYNRYADCYLDIAMRYARVPVKQAVISPSALSLMYPAEPIAGYSREQFIDDLLREHETDIRRCLNKGAHKVQVDFTEGRLAVKVDPTGHLLNSFIDLNNLALSRFSPDERRRIGVHTCPGNDFRATHSADVDYAELLPSLFELKAGNFYVALAGEPDRPHVLKIIGKHRKPDQRIFVGVIAPGDPRIETPEEVRDRVLEASEHIPIEQLGTTDDCGFSPFFDNTSTSRDTAFAKIQARVRGTALAANLLGAQP